MAAFPRSLFILAEGTGPGPARRWRNSSTPEPDYEERAILAFILYLRDEGRLSWRKISDAVERRLAQREHRPPVPAYQGETARRFGFTRCARAYKVARELGVEPVSAF
jgi:hypothetical protein